MLPWLHRVNRCCTLFRKSAGKYVRMKDVRPPFRVSAKGRVANIAAPDTPDSISTYGEVIIEDCYRLYSTDTEARIIVDVGANIGVFSSLARLIFPEATIH